MTTYTLEGLEFSPHPATCGIQATLTFPNGWGLSVVGGPIGRGLCGDDKYTFEVAYITPHGDIEWDVFPWRTIAQVEDLMNSLASLWK